MDKDNTAKEKYQAKHEQGLELAAIMYRIGETEKAQQLQECGTSLGFARDEEGGLFLMDANFCRLRLCPMCGWRRSVRIFAATSKILDWCDVNSTAHKYLFLTLTVRNCPGNQLGQTIDTMAEAYKRMTNNRAWKRRVLGAMRTLEITYNRKDNTYHPHYHMILAVPPEYGKKTNDLYWNTEEWAACWRKSARLDYDPQIKIERVKGRRKGIAEVSKYAVKSTDYLCKALTDEQQEKIVRTLQDHMHGRRLISYTGILREAQQALRIKDAEAMDLTDKDDIRGDVSDVVIRLRWAAGLGNYIRTER